MKKELLRTFSISQEKSGHGSSLPSSFSRAICTIFNDTQIIKIIKLAFPALIEFLLQSVVQYIDLYMVGELGVNATAVVGLGSQVQFLVKFPIVGMYI